MGLGDDIKQVAGQVASDLGGVAKDVAKTATKTPLDMLEEILGGDPTAGDGKSTTPEAMADVEKGTGAAQDDAAKKAAIQQRVQQDQQETQDHLLLHRKNMHEAEEHYEQQKAEAAQEKQVEQQQEAAKEDFKIEQLEHENLQVSTAKMAADAERSRNMGSG